jgi:hypothetical protein
LAKKNTAPALRLGSQSVLANGEAIATNDGPHEKLDIARSSGSAALSDAPGAASDRLIRLATVHPASLWLLPIVKGLFNGIEARQVYALLFWI